MRTFSNILGPAVRNSGLAAAGLILLMLAGCGALPGGQSELEDRPVLTDVAQDSSALMSLINTYRRQNGLPDLRHDPALDAVSQDMARHIAQRDSMDTWQHSAFGLSQRLDKARYPNYAAAENLGAGYADLAAAFRGWQGSEGHNKNLLNPYVSRVGIARTNRSNGKWRNFWAMTLARPQADGRPVPVN